MARQKSNRTALVGTLVIVALMVLSSIGYLFKGSEKERYQGVTFTRQEDNRWHTTVNGKAMAFSYLPSQLENINVSPDALALIKGARMAYLTYDSGNRYRSDIALIALELNKLMWDDFQIYLSSGLTTENKFSQPVVTCANATAAMPVLFFTESEQSGIALNNSCILFEGKTNLDYYLLKERLLYSLYGIMP